MLAPKGKQYLYRVMPIVSHETINLYPLPLVVWLCKYYAIKGKGNGVG